MTVQVITALGAPGVLLHGINVRPGKPTIIGVCNGKVVLGLPGNPVSCLLMARLLLLPAIKKWLGQEPLPPQATLPARLTTNVSSKAGREDWIPVRLKKDPGRDAYDAEPIFSKSNHIFSMVRANGWLRILPDLTGLESGQEIAVYIFDK